MVKRKKEWEKAEAKFFSQGFLPKAKKVVRR